MNNNSWVPIVNLYLVYLYLPTKHIMESKDLLKVNFLHLILDLKNSPYRRKNFKNILLKIYPLWEHFIQIAVQVCFIYKF